MQTTLPLVRNARQRMDGWAMLNRLKDGCTKLAVIDPQYRGVMDKMKYGNEGARQKARAELPQMDYPTISRFLLQLRRVLKPSGHVLLWADKFSVASGDHKTWTPKGLTIVDMIGWDKGRIGMGRRSRGQMEFLIVLQKEPTRAKGIWIDHGIPDIWTEQADSSTHPHAKPLMLQQRLIRCLTKRGDLVIDPCAGGYGVMEACRATGRAFMGCDLATPEDPAHGN